MEKVNPKNKQDCKSLHLFIFLVIATSCCCFAARPKIHPAPAPQIVEYRFDNFACLFNQDSTSLQDHVAALGGKLRDQGDAYPQRLIALRLRDLPLEYAQLNSIQKNLVRQACELTTDPAMLYETSVCCFIKQSLHAAGDSVRGHFGTLGLPFEAYGRTSAAADSANANYAALISCIDVFLPAQSFILSDTTATTTILQNNVPVSLAYATTQRVMVRVNDSWIFIEPPAPIPPPVSEAPQETGSAANGITWTVYHPTQPTPDTDDKTAVIAAPTSSPDLPLIPAIPSANDESITIPPSTLAATISDEIPDYNEHHPQIYDETGFWNPEASEDYLLEDLGLDETTAEERSIENFKQAWLENDLFYDLNSDGTVDHTDLQILTTLIPPSEPTSRKRLLHFQSVGFSSLNEFGFVSPNTCTPEAGWNVHVDNRLQSLVEHVGNNAFDWWGHNTGGVWEQRPIQMIEGGSSTIMLYEQLFIARYRYPQLVNYAPLENFANDHGINLYGYIGFPRCHSGETNTGQSFAFTTCPEHGRKDQILNWYREFIQFGFVGVGHDATGRLPNDSVWLQKIVPILRQLNIEVFLEANSY